MLLGISGVLPRRHDPVKATKGGLGGRAAWGSIWSLGKQQRLHIRFPAISLQTLEPIETGDKKKANFLIRNT